MAAAKGQISVPILAGSGRSTGKGRSTSEKIILTLLPSHDNLGDHAIAYASKVFLEQEYPDFDIVEVDMKDIYKSAKSLIRSRHPEDMVFIIGGGNMGDLYRYEEWTRRFIIKTFRDYRVIQLPATAHFSDTKKGRKELKRAQKIYNAHPGLLLMARDETTYQFMKQHFQEKTILKQPDMVLYLDRSKTPQNAKGFICVCARIRKACFRRTRGTGSRLRYLRNSARSNPLRQRSAAGSAAIHANKNLKHCGLS